MHRFSSTSSSRESLTYTTRSDSPVVETDDVGANATVGANARPRTVVHVAKVDTPLRSHLALSVEHRTRRSSARTAMDARMQELVSAASRFDRALLVTWCALSSIMLAIVIAASWQRRRLVRRASRELGDTLDAIYTRDVGPAVAGVLRPQVIFPAWVRELTPTFRTLILAHEHEHGISKRQWPHFHAGGK